MLIPNAKGKKGSDIRLTWDERTEVEEAEPAAEAALRCGARRMVQIAN
jgi:hypothetical protein